MTRELGPFWRRLVDEPELAARPDDATFDEKRTVAPPRTVLEAPPPITAVRVLPPLPLAGQESEHDLELLEVLGEGGMGIVRRARQRSLDREVAVKSLKREHANAASVEALLAEARVAGGLEHPNVIPVHALGRDGDGNVVLVMKRVEGETWAKLLENPDHPFWTRTKRWSRDPFTRNVQVFLEVCDAVSYAHARGILHRDLKPDNVMVGAFGEVYLGDWGLAVREGRGPFALGGTLAYMAPEMLDGEATVATDVFLLGAILHELLTGKRRHVGATRAELLGAISRCDPVLYDANVPSELAFACRRATEARPEDRYPDVASLRQAIADHLEHRGSQQLARVASERLSELERLLATVTPEPALVARLATECRFGFGQALEAWRENESARRGLDRCLLGLAEYEASRGSPLGALALLSELRTRGADPARVEEIARKAEARRLEAERATRLAAELDPGVSVDERRKFIFLLLALTVPTLIALTATVGMNIVALRTELALGLPIVGLVVLLAILRVGRRSLLKNEFNRRVSGSLIVLLCGWFLHRVVSTQLGIPIIKIVQNDFALGSMAAALAGVGLGMRSLFGLAALLAVIAIVSTVVPEHLVYVVLGVGTVLIAAIVVGIVRGSLR